MTFIKEPQKIESKSMDIIAPYLAAYPWSVDEKKVASRMIHASGDVEYAPHIRFASGAVSKMQLALKAGCSVYTDVEMVRTGINKRRLKKLGGEVFCHIAEPLIFQRAKAHGTTRSMEAMYSFGKSLNGSIIAIGNAPTALFAVMEMCKEQKITPAGIIGTPVGFVGAAEAKQELFETDLPYVTVLGTKGGSSIAAAAVNAILYSIAELKVE